MASLPTVWMPEYILSGALVGFLVGATGVGGGSLMTPLLTLIFGVPAQVAIGTDLLFASLTKASGAFALARRGSIPWQVVARLSAGSIPAALLTLAALHTWHPDAARFAAVVRPLLGSALVLTAGAVLLRGRLQPRALAAGAARLAPAGTSPLPAAEAPSALAPTLAVGAVIGSLVTLTSVGAGAIGVIALFMLYPALAPRRLVGADIVHAVPLTLVAGLSHASLGTVDWRMLAALLAGSLPAVHAGVVLGGRLPVETLRRLIALVLLLVGARLLMN
jgi:uncharacterized membrane protein YfcA